MALPSGRIPNATLEYCVIEAGGSIEEFEDNGAKFKSIKLGHRVFTAVSNRVLLEKIFTSVSELPE